jgi:SpoVK/Ycf46/Vps4 family AAA+-type ATPase
MCFYSYDNIEGTGKTMLAKAVATEVRYSAVQCIMSSAFMLSL